MSRDASVDRHTPGIARFLASRNSISLLGVVTVAGLVTLAGFFVMQIAGLPGLTLLVGGLLAIIILGVVSLRRVEIILLIWLVSLMGFRLVMIVNLPGMPDISPDRLFMVWALGAMFLNALSEPRPARPPFLLDTLIVIHTLYLLASCLIANPEAFNLWTRSYLMPAAGYFFGKYIFCDAPWYGRMVRLLVVLNLYMGITSIAEHFHINAIIWPRYILHPEYIYIGRSQGIFQQPGVLGVFIGMVLPLQVYLHLTSRSTAARWLHLVGIVICAVGLFYTYTRGPWLAAGAGLVVLALAGRRVYTRRLLAYGIVIAVIGATGALRLKSDTFLQQRLGNENTIEGRINVAATSYRIWQAYPFLGAGFKRFNDIKQNYRETLDVPIYGLIKANIDKRSSPHDIYIAVLAEEGLVGAGMQAWIYALIIGAFWRMYRRRGTSANVVTDELLPPIGALMICYFVGGTAFDYRFFETLNSLFYVFAGVLFGWYSTGRARVRVVAAQPSATGA